MSVIRTVARWTGLASILAYAAASVVVSAVIQACGGASTDTSRGAAVPDAKPEGGNHDAAADAQDGSADAASDEQAADVVPNDDVSLDTMPAE